MGSILECKLSPSSWFPQEFRCVLSLLETTLPRPDGGQSSGVAAGRSRCCRDTPHSGRQRGEPDPRDALPPAGTRAISGSDQGHPEHE